MELRQALKRDLIRDNMSINYNCAAKLIVLIQFTPKSSSDFIYNLFYYFFSYKILRHVLAASHYIIGYFQPLDAMPRD